MNPITSPINQISNDRPIEFDLSVLYRNLDRRNMDGVDVTLQPGLNMLGICRTQACPDAGNPVVVPWSWGFQPNEILDINEVRCKSNCPRCLSVLAWEDITEMVLTETCFKVEAMSAARFRIDQQFGIHRGDFIRINIAGFRYLHVTLNPLEVSKTKLD